MTIFVATENFISNSFFFCKNFSNFLTKIKIMEKEEKNCGCLSGHNFGHPLDRKHFF